MTQLLLLLLLVRVAAAAAVSLFLQQWVALGQERGARVNFMQIKHLRRALQFAKKYLLFAFLLRLSVTKPMTSTIHTHTHIQHPHTHTHNARQLIDL